MILYAESSAVLAWLLGERDGVKARELLAQAKAVFASRLVIAEVERALVRLEAGSELQRADAVIRRQALARASGHWLRFTIDDAVLRRVGQPFPVEPVRTLDAIHLATLLEVVSHEPRVSLLSFDRRIRDNATRLGVAVMP